MCRKTQTKVGAFLAVANVFLLLGLLGPYLYHPATQVGRDWRDATRGLAFGLYIGINLIAVWKGRRSRGCDAGSGQAGSRQQ
jgi:hypothetical protein